MSATTPDYNANVYVAVELTPSSLYSNTPISLAAYPSLSHAGNVGELTDVKLLSIPKNEWQGIGEDILQILREDTENVLRVYVQEQRSRKKRGDLEHEGGGHDEL
ncbi:hypothetical protein EW145_g6733 [Phellinidium pouzarii]|uniref:Uncharacterized protein n=1 Tax=Phellinidium pouzarii TaxID=167371 RepID=A0A4S4KVG0_9AGAM|nr:hypothetical protein EW145_g6733 [Phellinidium pouzarii]